MKILWGWVQENSAALQGMAAIVLIIGALVTIYSFGIRALQPDILIRVNIDDSTIPPDLIDFSRDVSRFFYFESDALKDIKDKNERFSTLLDSDILKRLDGSVVEFDKASIEIINQSENIISGLRIRFDDVFSLWGFDINGTFLRKNEIDKFKAAFGDGVKGSTIVLPELPIIPANSSIKLTLYGNLDLLKTVVTTVGNSYSISEIIKIEDSMLVRWLLKPMNFIILLLVLLPVSLSMFGVVWQKIRNHVIKDEMKHIFYNKACELAINGNEDDAMLFLQQAVDAGYTNKQHALKDEDLESLRERKGFNGLFKKT